MSENARRRIYLMRHAQVRYFEGIHPHEVQLTELGRHQAAAARDALQDVRFERVLTSGLPRTLETARIVAPYAEVEGHDALREIESGELRGLDPEEIQAMMTGAFAHNLPLDSRFLGGESYRELYERVVPAVEAFLDDTSWDVALLVLHGAVNRTIVSWALLGEPSFLGGFEQAPGCINVLDVDVERRFIVRAVNHTPYDPVHAAAARETTMEQLWREYLERK
jgi:broad specificity phosphatase PhoE